VNERTDVAASQMCNDMLRKTSHSFWIVSPHPMVPRYYDAPPVQWAGASYTSIGQAYRLRTALDLRESDLECWQRDLFLASRSGAVSSVTTSISHSVGFFAVAR
jgi:hypothetical protein